MDGASGYVVDLKQLADLIKAEIIQHVDHHNLNTDIPWLEGWIPTVETPALVFFNDSGRTSPAALWRACGCGRWRRTGRNATAATDRSLAFELLCRLAARPRFWCVNCTLEWTTVRSLDGESSGMRIAAGQSP
jgi:6-pyruvoyl-tetrahydropterin synthase